MFGIEIKTDSQTLQFNVVKEVPQAFGHYNLLVNATQSQVDQLKNIEYFAITKKDQLPFGVSIAETLEYNSSNSAIKFTDKTSSILEGVGYCAGFANGILTIGVKPNV